MNVKSFSIPSLSYNTCVCMESCILAVWVKPKMIQITVLILSMHNKIPMSSLSAIVSILLRGKETFDDGVHRAKGILLPESK